MLITFFSGWNPWMFKYPLLLWRYSKPTWLQSYAACSRWTFFGRRVELDDLLRSLPTPTILWFCEFSCIMTKINLVWKCFHKISKLHRFFRDTCDVFHCSDWNIKGDQKYQEPQCTTYLNSRSAHEPPSCGFSWVKDHFWASAFLWDEQKVQSYTKSYIKGYCIFL